MSNNENNFKRHLCLIIAVNALFLILITVYSIIEIADMKNTEKFEPSLVMASDSDIHVAGKIKSASVAYSLLGKYSNPNNPDWVVVEFENGIKVTGYCNFSKYNVYFQYGKIYSVTLSQKDTISNIIEVK